MTSLLGHGEANGISPLLCALERGRAELQDERMRVRDAALCWVPRSGGEECGSGLPVIARMASPGSGSLHRSDASLPGSIPHLLGHCFGAFATPGGKLALLLSSTPSRVTVSICDGPSVNAELRPWESRPLA
jgi:hypothetical protein